MLLTRSPLSPAPKGWFSLDLHVLSAPPAFVLSQDQTLREGTCVNPTPGHRLTMPVKEAAGLCPVAALEAGETTCSHIELEAQSHLFAKASLVMPLKRSAGLAGRPLQPPRLTGFEPELGVSELRSRRSSHAVEFSKTVATPRRRKKASDSRRRPQMIRTSARIRWSRGAPIVELQGLSYTARVGSPRMVPAPRALSSAHIGAFPPEQEPLRG